MASNAENVSVWWRHRVIIHHYHRNKSHRTSQEYLLCRIYLFYNIFYIYNYFYSSKYVTLLLVAYFVRHQWFVCGPVSIVVFDRYIFNSVHRTLSSAAVWFRYGACPHGQWSLLELLPWYSVNHTPLSHFREQLEISTPIGNAKMSHNVTAWWGPTMS